MNYFKQMLDEVEYSILLNKFRVLKRIQQPYIFSLSERFFLPNLPCHQKKTDNQIKGMPINHCWKRMEKLFQF